MYTVYNLEMQLRDKLKRIKNTVHVGVYKSLDEVEIAKLKMTESNPGTTFEVYPCEHILFEQPAS